MTPLEYANRSLCSTREGGRSAGVQQIIQHKIAHCANGGIPLLFTFKAFSQNSCFFTLFSSCCVCYLQPPTFHIVIPEISKTNILHFFFLILEVLEGVQRYGMKKLKDFKAPNCEIQGAVCQFMDQKQNIFLVNCLYNIKLLLINE